MRGDSPVTGHLFDRSSRIVEKYSGLARIHKGFGGLRTLIGKRSFAGFPVVRIPFRICEMKIRDLSNSIWLSHVEGLRMWRENTAYRSDEDWIFASPHYHGKTPYTYQILFRRHIRPVIEKVAGIKSSKEAPIGWHTLRRSLATLLMSNGENVKVAQSQLRRTTPKITLDLYAQAVSSDQHEAHKKVVQMVLPAEFPERLKALGAIATA